MPQGPFQTVSLGAANKSALNITANTVVKATPGFVVSLSVVVAGSGAGSINDAATVAAAAAAEQYLVASFKTPTYAFDQPGNDWNTVRDSSLQHLGMGSISASRTREFMNSKK
jgi:hypothetical protein